jgi:hypothetical protein
MAIVELQTRNRSLISVGGTDHSLTTVSLISLPSSDSESLQIFSRRQIEPTHLSWLLVPPERGESLVFQWKRAGEIKEPSTEWLVKPGKNSRTQISPRMRQFKCTVRLAYEEWVSTADGSASLQLTIESHFARLLPRLLLGCFDGNSQGESWMERPLPFDQDVILIIE